MKGTASKLIHGVTIKKDPHGALRMPVYDTAAFEFESARDLELAFRGKKPSHAYSRITNPTVEDFEQKVKLLSDAFGVLALSSGMAAIANTILTLAESGSNIITSKYLFGNTVSLFESTLGDWGLSVKYADMADPESLRDLIDDKTRAVFLESITNPQLQVANFKKIAEISSEKNVPVLLDGTMTTPYIMNSKKMGIAVELISSTKFITGGATSIGGLIIDNGVFDWSKNPKLKDATRQFGPFSFLMKLRREAYRNLGSCLSAHNAWLQTLGLETLTLRIDKCCENSQKVAEFLATHPKVASANYPGLPHSEYHEIAKEHFAKGRFGGLLTFDLNSQEECFKVIDSVKMIRRATNLNDNKTLIIHPSSTICVEYDDAKKAEMGVRDTLIRLAVGIEDPDDIIEDLKQGLDQL